MILISGIPASGKSCYSQWLAKKSQFEYYDVDAKRELPPLEDISISLILDWGFPVNCIEIVKNLKSKGIEMWWFDGDRSAARISFQRRAAQKEKLTKTNLYARMKEFEMQMKSIDNEWASIAKLFENRIIETIRVGPTYKSCEHIYKEICSRQSSPNVTS